MDIHNQGLLKYVFEEGVVSLESWERFLARDDISESHMA